jgi:hypothetical protein
VDFLGTHMISLVLFFRKPGVTVKHHNMENFAKSPDLSKIDRSTKLINWRYSKSIFELKQVYQLITHVKITLESVVPTSK